MRTISLIIMIALFFTACKQEREILPSGKILKIGVMAPLGGKYKRLGNQGLIGLKAANKMNRYLKNGDEIVFEIVDTKSELKNSKKVLSELAKKDIKAIISFMGSSETLSMKQDFKDYKIPTVLTLATDNNLVSKGGYISQVCIDNDTQVLIASHYIRDEKLIQKVGVIYNKDSYYSSILAKQFKNYFISIGGSVEFFLDLNKQNALNRFENMKKKDIKMLYNTSNGVLSAKILDIMNRKNFDFDMLGADGLYSDVLELGHNKLKLFDGVYVVEHYAHNANRDSNYERLGKILDKDGFNESSNAFLAYDSYQLLMHALEKCSDYSLECIDATFENSGIIKGVAGNFSMVDSKVKREVYINKIENSLLKKEVVIY